MQRFLLVLVGAIVAPTIVAAQPAPARSPAEVLRSSLKPGWVIDEDRPDLARFHRGEPASPRIEGILNLEQGPDLSCAVIRAFAERKGLGDKVRPPALPSTPSGWVSLVGHESELGGNRLLCRNLGPFVMSLTLTYQPLAPADTAALGELMERIENEIALEHLAIIGSDESQQQLRLLGLGVNILRVAQGASWRIADTPNTTADVVVQTDPFGAPARISLRFDRPGICAAFLAMAEKRGWTRASGGTSWLPSPWNAPVLVEPNTEFASMRTCVETRTGALGVSYFGERIPTAEESPGIAFMLSTVYEAKHAGPTAAAATTTTVSSSVDRSRPPSSLGVFVGLGAAISSADTAPNRYPETMGFELLRRGVKPGKRVGLTIGGALEGGLDLPGLFFLAEGGSTRVGYTVDANVVAGLGVRLGRALLHPLAMLGYDAIKDIAPGEGYIGPALHGLVPVGGDKLVWFRLARLSRDGEKENRVEVGYGFDVGYKGKFGVALRYQQFADVAGWYGVMFRLQP